MYFYLQYFEILQNSKLKADKIDRFFERICLCWHEPFEEDGNLLPGIGYGIIPVGANRGCVHLVQQITVITKIDKKDLEPRAAIIFMVCKGKKGLEEKMFKVNRLFDKGRDDVDYTESDSDCE